MAKGQTPMLQTPRSARAFMSKAGTEPPKIACLPKIPCNGLMSIIEPKVLLSSVDELFPGGRPYSSRGSCYSAGRPATSTSLSVGPHRPQTGSGDELKKSLFYKDIKAKPRRLNAILPPTTPFPHFDIDDDDVFSQVETTTLYGTTGFESAANLSQTLSVSTLRNEEPDPGRMASIRNSFRHTKEQVDAKLFRMEERSWLRDGSAIWQGDSGVRYRADTTFTTTTTDEPESPQRTMPRHNSIWLDSDSVDSRDSDEQHVDESALGTADGSLRSFVCEYEKSKVATVPLREVRKVPGLTKDDIGVVSTVASYEEVSAAVELLNFLRWCCGLAPVTVGEDAVRASDCVAKLLSARLPVFMQDVDVHSSNMLSIGHYIGMFLNRRRNEDENLAVIHKETSLIEAMGLCVSAAHTYQAPDDSRLPEARLAEVKSTTLNPTDESVRKILMNSQRYVSEDAEARAAQRLDFVDTLAAERLALKIKFDSLRPEVRPYVEEAELPEAFRHLRLLWSLGLTSASSPPEGMSSQSPTVRHTARRTANGRWPWPAFKPQLHARANCAGRVRQEPSPLLLRDKKKEAQETADLFRGDRENLVGFRRSLLSPWTTVVGAARQHDTCAVWTQRRAGGEDMEDGDSRQFVEPRQIPEVVCFPPPGIFPHEMLHARVPVWTIMPDFRFFQPTQELSVRMWRVRIDLSSYSARRLEEVEVTELSCDCSVKGNPFCIIFKPKLLEVAPGEQFEVEVEGLRGRQTSWRCFHDFPSFRLVKHDSHFLMQAERFRSLLDDQYLWRRPQETVGGMVSNLQAAAQGPVSGTTTAIAVEHLDIGLVSHPNTDLVLDSPEAALTLHCPQAAAIRASLLIVRGSGTKEEIKRATVVMRFQDYFMVRLRVPMAPAKYALTFRVALHGSPEAFTEHPLKYSVTTSEYCGCLLTSLEHPWRDFFGFSVQPPAAQNQQVTLVTPTDYRVTAGYVYFAVCVDTRSPYYPQASNRLNDPPIRPTATRLFSHRLAPQKPPKREGEASRGSKQHPAATQTVKAEGAGDKAAAQAAKKSRSRAARRATMKMRAVAADYRANSIVPEGATCAVGRLHRMIAEPLQPHVQDAADMVHVDISVLHYLSGAQRYCLRLRPRADVANLFDGLVYFADVDVNCKVEMMLSYPGAHDRPEYAPLKIGEWVVIKREESFPEGF
eukprot:TRINITY_DN6149_c0_g1_i1.p1 TRINITY_DN6149_c0_g1~~TRINITY_DN6149_c0_g1_i1.p1  ORF type:complete len:1180 (+),score=265.70 TRINITY_DN6149_c0_g1_i1:200-3739(+)